SANTVLSAISHVSWYHIRNLGYSVGLHAGHNMAVRGMQRLSPPPPQKQPVTMAILREIRRRCNFQSAHDRVLWGAAVMGFFFLLRQSEYLADGTKMKPYIIQVNDVQFLSTQGVLARSIDKVAAVSIKSRGSKSDQVGAGATRTLHRSGSAWLCPVQATWELVQNSRMFSSNEALCATGTGKVLAANRLAKAIKCAAAAAGADPLTFGTHSMGSGGATALFATGVDRLTIKLFGRWFSDAFEQYTRMNEATTRSLAEQMERGARSHVSPVTLVGASSSSNTELD
ncbi:hypothetical protein PHYSODRAFT_492524, partial [Phytophthora sojae]